MITKPHTHVCPYCQQEVPCEAASTGGCIFPSTVAISCTPCIAERFGMGPGFSLPTSGLAIDSEGGVIKLGGHEKVTFEVLP